jgi:hypothetical protein
MYTSFFIITKKKHWRQKDTSFFLFNILAFSTVHCLLFFFMFKSIYKY